MGRLDIVKLPDKLVGRRHPMRSPKLIAIKLGAISCILAVMALLVTLKPSEEGAPQVVAPVPQPDSVAPIDPGELRAAYMRHESGSVGEEKDQSSDWAREAGTLSMQFRGEPAPLATPIPTTAAVTIEQPQTDGRQ
jgi:hypothetical protein